MTLAAQCKFKPGDEVVVCLPGSMYDGLGGTVTGDTCWGDGADGAIEIDTAEGKQVFAPGTLRHLGAAE